MIYIYNLLFYALMPFLPLRLLWKARKNPAYLRQMQQRFASYKTPALPTSIWIHAVSVGESIAIVPLIKSLKAKHPNIPLVVTSMTPTGAYCIKQQLGNTVTQLYIPYDYPQAIKRFLKHIHPKLLIIVETELWPNMLRLTAKANIPIILVNARLSAKSFRGYKKIGKFTKQMLESINYIMAQSAEDQERFLKLGATPKQITVNGNVKFDLQISQDIVNQAKKLREKWQSLARPTLIAASTHDGEETLVLNSFEIILEKHPKALLILVPRHPERFNAVAELCISQNFKIARISENDKVTAATNVILGDTMGQLLLLYATADVAFVGGSFSKTGGHNVLEPAALNIPIITGPSLYNFKKISSLMLKANAMIKLDVGSKLALTVTGLLNDADLRKQYSKAAQVVLEQNQGATKRILDEIEKFIN